MDNKQIIPVICLLVAMVLWASSFIALKLAFLRFDPFFVIFCRMLIASVVFVLFLRPFKDAHIRRTDIKYLLAMSLFEPCLYFIFEAKALTLTSASQAGMITSMLPLAVALGAFSILGESITKHSFTGFVIAVAGAFLLSFSSEASTTAPNPALGNFLEFIAMICAAGYTLTLKKLSSNYRSLTLTAIQMITGSVFFLPFVITNKSSIPEHVDPFGIFLIMYLGIVVTVAAYGLYNFGVSRMKASQAGAFINLIPVFTILLSWLILNETLTSLQWISCALIFAGVLMSQDIRTRMKSNPPTL